LFLATELVAAMSAAAEDFQLKEKESGTSD
jgi:hypothetical protein